VWQRRWFVLYEDRLNYFKSSNVRTLPVSLLILWSHPRSLYLFEPLCRAGSLLFLSERSHPVVNCSQHLFVFILCVFVFSILIIIFNLIPILLPFLKSEKMKGSIKMKDCSVRETDQFFGNSSENFSFALVTPDRTYFILARFVLFHLAHQHRHQH